MKILQASKAYVPVIGGIESVVQQLAEGLKHRHGYETEVLVCNTRMKTEREIIANIPVTRTGSIANIFSLPISPLYFNEILKQRADILHIHEPFPLGDLSYIAMLKLRRFNYKHLFIWWHSDIIRQKAFYFMYAPFIRRVLKAADCIIVATPNHITSSQFLPAVRNKCHVVHYGIDVSRFELKSSTYSLVSDIHKNYGRPLILFVGRLVYYKGLKYLIQAMKEVPTGRLIIVGDGPLKEELRGLAEQHASNRVSFLPPQNEPDLIALYHACDIFVLPSTEYSEQFGIVQLEAMACGKPVITTDIPTGVTYVNLNNVTGLTVPARDSSALARAINILVENPALRNRLGENARKRVFREFTLEGMVDQVAALYEEVLSR